MFTVKDLVKMLVEKTPRLEKEGLFGRTVTVDRPFRVIHNGREVPWSLDWSGDDVKLSLDVKAVFEDGTIRIEKVNP